MKYCLLFFATVLTFLFLSMPNQLRAQDLKRMGLEAAQKNNWSNAEKHFLDYTLNNPDDVNGFLLLSNALIKQKKYEQAADLLERQLLRGISKKEANQLRFQLSRTYAYLNDITKAAEYLSYAVNDGLRNVPITDSVFELLKRSSYYNAIMTRLQRNNIPCAVDTLYQKLNFWVGVWDVYLGKDYTQKVAVDSIYHSFGKCSIHESFLWTGGGNYKGQSMIVFDPGARKYRLLWAGNSGDIRNFEEISSSAGELLFMAVTTNESGELVHRRMKLTSADANTVYQYIENSSDLGRTWKVEFDAKFVKRSM